MTERGAASFHPGELVSYLHYLLTMQIKMTYTTSLGLGLLIYNKEIIIRKLLQQLSKILPTKHLSHYLTLNKCDLSLILIKN